MKSHFDSLRANTHILAALAALIAVLLTTPVLAQDTTSAIRGTVYGHDGQPLPAASVVVKDLRTGVQRTYSTNETGTFLAARLTVGGPYEVTVNGETTVTVDRIALGDIYYLPISLQEELEEVVVVGQAGQGAEDVAIGPAATYGLYELETSVAFNKDIVDVYTIDPRLNADNEDDGFAINCGGKHPRFNSITLDGVSQDDRFGLNENGYSTAVGMPFPYDAISQVSVELAPFDVTYGGFSACQINAVTKSGTNEWKFNTFYEYSNDSLKGDSLGDVPGDFSTASFNESRWGLSAGGPIIKDKLFVYAAYEESDRPRFLARGYAGSGNGVERDWLSEADYNRIVNIANNLYSYDPGGQPGDGSQETEKYMIRLDWNINENHNAALIYNYFDGFQDRDSDGDSDEFEFANHFYVKGAESETITLNLASQWTDAFSTEFFVSTNEMNDSQVTVGPKDFGDFQISIDRNTVYLGADDSRQANKLGTDSDFFKFAGQYLWRDHVFTFGYEREELSIFNVFVQHSRGGEWDFFDDSAGNPPHCAALTAQGRFEDPDCELSGIDRFELGRPSRVYYGSAGGTNDPFDAAANFTNNENALYFQDEMYWAQHDLTVVAGLRYEWFDSDDSPTFNQAFTDLYGFRNDATIDGVDLIMPRVGFTWGIRDDLTLRGGIGRYSGGNPNVWISNSYSNDGITNVQLRNNYFDCCSVFDGTIVLTGPSPGRDVPQDMVDEVLATTADDASNSFLAIIDPDYEQPNEWKFAIGATYQLPFWDIEMDVDYLHTEVRDPAYYVDLSQEIVGMTTTGVPIYDYVRGRDNFMLTNSNRDADSDVISVVFNKNFANGLDMMLGYAHTDATDVSPMTSSVAGSNFDNTALLDVNDPTPGTSNYVVPHRFTFRASYGKEFIEGYETRITTLGYYSEGQPQSYVMGSNDLEGDGFFGRHLLYVPDGPSDPNVVFEPDFDQAAFFEFAARNGLGPGFVARNGRHAGWTTRFDLRIDQEIPTFFKDTKGRLYLKIYNLGNLINDDWGHVVDAQFFSVQVVNSSVNDQGQFVYERFSDRSIEDLLENRSLYDIRLGVEIDF